MTTATARTGRLSRIALWGVVGLLGVWMGTRLLGLGASTLPGTPSTIPIGTPTRAGTPTPLTLPEPEGRGDCNWLFRLEAFEAISDKRISDVSTFYAASPLELREDGVLLTAHTRADTCDGGYAHSPQGLLVRPADGKVEGHTYTLTYTDEVVAMRRRGPLGDQALVYVLPGTSVTLPLGTAWQPAWGPPVVRMAALSSEATAQASLGFGDASMRLTPERGVVRTRLVARDGAPPTAVVIASPADGPVLVVHDLVVGEGDAATPIVGSVSAVDALPDPAAAAAPASVGLVPAVARRGLVPTRRLELQPGEAGTCRYVAKTPELAEVSDLRLYERFGYMSGSPAMVAEDGAQLTPHDRGVGCTGAFAHAPQALVIRPTEGDATNRRYTLSWDPSPTVPLRQRGGAEITASWVYPGTALVVTFPGPLRPDAYEVLADVLVLGGVEPASARLAGVDHPLPAASDDQLLAAPGPPEGLWEATFTSPADGPFLLVRGFEARPLAPAGEASEVVLPAEALPGSVPVTLEGMAAWTVHAPEGADVAASVVVDDQGRDAVEVQVGDPVAAGGLCSPWIDRRRDSLVRASLKVKREDGEEAVIVDEWLDRDGNLIVRRPGTTTTHALLDDDQWHPYTFAFPRPPDGVRVRFCAHLREGTGRLAVAQVTVTDPS